MYVESRKVVQMNQISGQKYRQGQSEQTYGHQWGRGGWDGFRDGD